MHCPYCKNKNVHKRGHFYKKSTRTYIRRYSCPACQKSFSAQTQNITFGQKRPDLNLPIYKLLCSGVSKRQIARILNCRFFTVYTKFLWLAQHAKTYRDQQKFNLTELQFDEMQSIEHTKLKPLTIALAVSESFEILGVRVGSLPATGTLAQLSLKKYGPRTNESEECIRSLLATAKSQIQSENFLIKSDEKPGYRKVVVETFGTATQYEQHKSRGNKEKRRELKYTALEKKLYDPLFALNQRCAKLRDHVKRLTRRSWCTTKIKENLERHLDIYIAYNNGYRFF